MNKDSIHCNDLEIQTRINGSGINGVLLLSFDKASKIKILI